MVLFFLQIIVSILLITVIVLQMQGAGISSSFGGSGEFYRSKRSIEKLLFTATIVLSILFALLSLVLLIVH